MDITLFHEDAATFFDQKGLRDLASTVVRRSPLLRRATQGDRAAAEALHIGFWPFVREFELAIDKQALPRTPLVAKFGQGNYSTVRRKIVGIATAVREMKEEEGSHAAHWAKDAEHLGLKSLEGAQLPLVRALIDSAYTKDLPHFFAVLAGTEFIAEEMSRYLVSEPGFTGLFDRKRWIWGEIHLTPHEHGPSHLEIDMDLARAYSRSDTEARTGVDAAVRQTIDLFERAAMEVDAQLCGPLAKAA